MIHARESTPLSPFTTLRVGGPARFFIEAKNEAEAKAALEFAHDKRIPVHPLGGGSNLLVSDSGVDGLVLRVAIGGLAWSEEEKDTILLTAGAGVSWDAVVDVACARGCWGIENLAGIPGSVGGAAVQNIGAYGMELSSTFAHADVLDANGKSARIDKTDAGFGYRTSIFKTSGRQLVITHVAVRLALAGTPNLSYADLARAKKEGKLLTTPSEITAAVREIRARKFPSAAEGGSAGSFFKNPIVSKEQASALAASYADLPQFPQEDGRVKLSLAWLLDHVLSLKGLAHGRARLFERQPLVIVTQPGASASEVEALAQDVAARVHEATGIILEREVETFAE